MKKILAVTGIRSEYDLIYSVLKEFQKQNFDVSVVVSGAHLSSWHGNTYRLIEKDGFKIADKIDTLLNTDRETQRVKGVGFLTTALSQTCEREKPDFLLVLGDREESIATCLVGNYMNILTIHIGGGDPVFGNADDPIRFACSKLAHIHCTTSQNYADNLLKIGEDSFRIVNSGNTSYPNIHKEPAKTRKEISKFLDFDIENTDYVVFLKHPLSSEVKEAYRQMKISLDGVEKVVTKKNIKVVGIYPNTDPGSFMILDAINEIQNSNIRFFKTLPRDFFINIMRNALCLVGNSSMGILEAPFYKLPVVNIGNRQKGRLNAGNVEFVSYEKEKIYKAINKACFNDKYRDKIKKIKNPYGDETSSQKIVKFVKRIDVKDRKWYVKEKLC